MKKRLTRICRIFAAVMIMALAVGIVPIGSVDMALADTLSAPSISVKVENKKNIKVSIGETYKAQGYEVWVTTDTKYGDYKNENLSFYYDYNEERDNYVYAAEVKKNGDAKRTVTITNLPKGKVSVKVRAYTGNRKYSDFSDSISVKIDSGTTGYLNSYNFSNVKKGDIIKFGTYEKDFPINGKDPIEWIVLEKKKDSILVISKNIIDVLPYDTDDYAVTWEDSSLRKWLNSKFYNIAFNKKEKSMIKKTSNKNPDNSMWNIDGGDNTKDKVFLLSIDEATKKAYSFSSDKNLHDINRRSAPTEYAKAQGIKKMYKKDENPTSSNVGSFGWWLRSPGKGTHYAATVTAAGAVYETGDPVYTESKSGVRPAMWLKLK